MRIKKIVVAGGGTAGWMVAASLKKHFGDLVELSLIESPEVGRIGVGEATIPTIRRFYQSLGMRDVDVMRATQATCKLGIQFNDWHSNGSSFIHPFGLYGQNIDGVDFHHYWAKMFKQGLASQLGDYSLGVTLASNNKFTLPSTNPPSSLSVFDWALHMDAALFADHMATFAKARGVDHICATIAQVNTDNNTGNISSLTLDSGAPVTADLFIDCTGFKALLIEKTLGVQLEDWSHWLPCDSAWAVQTRGDNTLPPYTRVDAKQAGWQWNIPLQHRVGKGQVYCSKYQTDQSALDELLQSADGSLITEPKQLRFTAGRRKISWSKNCIAIGLAAGFLEPLESTSIALVETAIEKIKTMLTSPSYSDAIVNEFNQTTALEYERVRDFLILHYKLNRREDSDFWKSCAAMTIPDSLQHKLELFRSSGYIVNYRWEMFHQPSWLAIFAGFNYLPNNYHMRVDQINEQSVAAGLTKMKVALSSSVANAPDHSEFIRDYCAVEVVDEAH